MLGLSASVIQLLLGAVEEAPTLFEDAKAVFDEIGGAEGGVAKLIKAAASFSALAGHAANSAQAAHSSSPPVEQPAIATSQQSITGKDYAQQAAAAQQAVADTAPAMVQNGGTTVDANGNPILNAADQAAKAAQG